jgi:hypothetical protein
MITGTRYSLFQTSDNVSRYSLFQTSDNVSLYSLFQTSDKVGIFTGTTVACYLLSFGQLVVNLVHFLFYST